MDTEIEGANVFALLVVVVVAVVVWLQFSKLRIYLILHKINSEFYF